MALFSKPKTSTKMFVSHLSAPKRRGCIYNRNIEEKRYSKPFAKKLNRVYKKDGDKLKNRINQEIKEQLSQISKDNKKSNTSRRLLTVN